ncbi:MAG TPA: hypothetical protein VG733_09190 [Chthoniobacteraceae bacterium]|nr:hypothetical protein [Chthoniobacteraceae bacterium]
MTVKFADSYIDRLFAEKDIPLLHQMVSAVSKERPLPDEFWLFRRLVEWSGSSKSGVWQFYEGIDEPEYEQIAHALPWFDLHEIAEQFRGGKNSSLAPDRGATLGQWIDAHEQEIHAAAFNLILPYKDLLRSEA